MFFRFIATGAMLVLLTIPASGLALYPLSDANLIKAAGRLKAGDIKGAHDAAILATQDGMGDFLVGMTASKLGQWEEAAARLASAADRFPLLADYALYHQGFALNKLGKPAEARLPLQKLLKIYPASRLVRQAMLLLGDALFADSDYKEAFTHYEKFIEKYPAGADSLTALYQSALCREQLGDTTGAVATLRSMWLNYPAAAVAEKAEEKLQQLSSKGIPAAPYSPQELFNRAVTIYDLGKYPLAVKALSAIPLNGAGDEFAVKLQLKIGLAQYKSRQYKDSEKTLTHLLAKDQKREIADEAHFWLAKTLDKNKKVDEAFTAFLKITETAPRSPLAADALLEAAYIKKYAGNWPAALPLFNKFLTDYPDSPLLKSVHWEIAWGNYQLRDFTTAAEYFQKLTTNDSMREKALYWYGRSLGAGNNQSGAQAAFAELLADYPLGYYTLTYKKMANIKEEETVAPPAKNIIETLPLPAGQERVKALITLGLYDEAAKELYAQKKPKSLLGFARLYLEMENYAAAINLLKNERLSKPDKETASLWNTSYPRAYRDHVNKNAVVNSLPEGLVYSIIRAESSFSPTAKSPVGAIGLMQLMPATAAAIAQNGPLATGSLTRPELNIRFGTKHLKDLLDLYKGNLVMVVAAYNAGSSNVARWQKSFGALPQDEFIESITFRETREYVKKVLAGIEVYERLYKLDNGVAGKPAQATAKETPAS